jgi:glycosyltransferase involved in cell wall biosynthesis
MTFVAAIIPTYNRERCIERAIDSVLAQTYGDLEVIVVDDGSTDGTRERVSAYRDAVRYIVQENAGQSVARNRGVASTHAEWVAFLDSDDVWLPTKIERQLEFTQGVRADISFTDFSLKKDLDGEGHDSWRQALVALGKHRHIDSGVCRDPLGLVLGPGDLASTCTLLMRKSAFDVCSGYRVQYRRCQDIDMYVRLAVHHDVTFAYLDEVLTKVEWSHNATAELTYTYRLSAYVDAYRLASARGDDVVAARLKQAILNDTRALFGTCRRHRKYLEAADALARYLLVRVGLDLALPPVFAESSA